MSGKLTIKEAIICLLSFVPFFVIITYEIVCGITYNVNIEGYLKRAADANTVEMAKQELDRALSGIEQCSLTSGNSSVLWNTPNNDVTFWYNNIKESRKELGNIKEDASLTEQTNVLMKLRETLLDNVSKGGEIVTAPSGISLHPYRVNVILIEFVTTAFGLLCTILILYRTN